MAELGEIKIMWDEAEHAAQNKTKWIENGVALCLQGMKWVYEFVESSNLDCSCR